MRSCYKAMNTLQLRPITVENTHLNLSFSGMLTALLLLLGICGSIFAPLTVSAELLYPLAAGAGLILFLPLLCRIRFGSQAAFICLCTGFAVSLLKLNLAGGLCSVMNRLSDALGIRLAYNLPRFSASEAALPGALMWIALLLALGCIWLVCTRASFIAWLVSIILLLPGCLFNGFTPSIWNTALICGLVMLRLPSKMLLQRAVRGLFVSLCIVLIFALAFGSVCLTDITSLVPVSAVHDRLVSAVQYWRFGKSAGTALPQGDFSQLGSLNRTDNSMLEITMNRAESLYLRGYVGSDYNGNSWKAAAPEALWDGAELFFWLHRNGFYGETQLSTLSSLIGSAKAAPVEMSIRHTGASRDIIYTPYELIKTGEGLPDPNDVGDICLRRLAVRWPDSYALFSDENLVSQCVTLSRTLFEQETSSADEALNAYLNNESHYNRFVYTHFLDMPETARALMASIFGGQSYENNEHMAYTQAKQIILEWLSNNVEYSESISTLDSDTDFLEDFLLLSGIGYDIHYAAAATIMMRYFGIPARYVEGYLITPDTAAEIQPGSAFTLTEADAHAWTEIYMDGIGWVPFETAPGYQNLMPQEDQLSGTGTSQNQIQNEAQSNAPLTENSLDMTEDFHEDPDEEDIEQKKIFLPVLMLCLIALAALILLIGLTLLLYTCISRVRKCRQLRLKNRKQAVLNLYAYLFELMQRLYNWKDCVAPSGFERTVCADMGADIAAMYMHVMNICRFAAFSGGSITEQDYVFVYNFVMKTRKLVKKRLPQFRKQCRR